MQKPRVVFSRFKNWLMEKKIRLVSVSAGAVLLVALVLMFSWYQERLRARVVKVSGTIEGDNVRISFRSIEVKTGAPSFITSPGNALFTRIKPFKGDARSA